MEGEAATGVEMATREVNGNAAGIMITSLKLLQDFYVHQIVERRDVLHGEPKILINSKPVLGSANANRLTLD